MQICGLTPKAKLKGIKFRPILPPRPTLLLFSFKSYGLCKLDLFASSELGTTAIWDNFGHDHWQPISALEYEINSKVKVVFKSSDRGLSISCHITLLKWCLVWWKIIWKFWWNRKILSKAFFWTWICHKLKSNGSFKFCKSRSFYIWYYNLA